MSNLFHVSPNVDNSSIEPICLKTKTFKLKKKKSELEANCDYMYPAPLVYWFHRRVIQIQLKFSTPARAKMPLLFKPIPYFHGSFFFIRNLNFFRQAWLCSKPRKNGLKSFRSTHVLHQFTSKLQCTARYLKKALNNLCIWIGELKAQTQCQDGC